MTKPATQTPLLAFVLSDSSRFFTSHVPNDLTWSANTFENVWHLHPPEKHRIKIHGREVETPRWQQAFERDYHYSRMINQALPVPSLLEPLLTWVKAALDERLNGILVNWYQGPGHYIGAHHDSVKYLVPAAPIVTVSFGETRTFRLTRGKGLSKEVRDFPAIQGTVFLMPFATNLAWKHEVIKSARYVGRRISVTFRAFLDRPLTHAS